MIQTFSCPQIQQNNITFSCLNSVYVQFLTAFEVFARWCDPQVHDRTLKFCTCARKLKALRFDHHAAKKYGKDYYEQIWGQRSDIVNKYIFSLMQKKSSSNTEKFCQTKIIHELILEILHIGMFFCCTNYIHI